MQIVEIPYASAHYGQAKRLRDEVLRRPLGMVLSDRDTAGEETQWHMAALAGDEVIACLGLKPLEGGIAKFRQMVVSPEHQGTGLGRRMMQFGEQLARSRGLTCAELHARQYAQGFYEKLGYRAEGGVFMEVGIPHIKMTKAKL